jgi:acyl-coenzyme A synthetase/AMP-(fatty) acid ligase
VVVPQAEADAHPAILLRDLQRHGVTHLVAVPSLLHTMFDIAASAGTTQQLKLRSVICSGEVLQPELLAQLRRALPAIRVFNTYGTTETWDAAVRIYEPGVGGKSISIGIPLPGVAAWVLDEQLKPLPVGVWGQLYVGGVGLSLGYVGSAANDDWLQQSTHSVLAETDLYATGDRVRWTAEGELEIGGRCDRQINLRGFRIEPAEVEQHLLHHPAVAQAAVMHRIDPGAERRYLVAYLTAANAADQPEPSVLKEFLRGWLPALAVPVIYVWMPALPLTPSGKTDYLNLPEVDSRFAYAVATEYSAPATATEKELADIWQSVLGVERVGRDDDFFALHGHSLMAAKLMSRVCDAFATDLPLQCLFEHPTLRGFAASVDTIRWVMNSDNVIAEKADTTNREVLRF